MEPFHAFLTIECRLCKAPLLRIGLSANNDIVVCPVCLRSGGFDDVLEEGAELVPDSDLPEAMRELIRRSWADHNRARP